MRLAAIFGPEHGAAGPARQATRCGATSVDPRTGVPVHSLYGDGPPPDPRDARRDRRPRLRHPGRGRRAPTRTSRPSTEVLGRRGRRASSSGSSTGRSRSAADICRGSRARAGARVLRGAAHAVPLRHGLTVGEFARMANEREGARGRSPGDPHGGLAPGIFTTRRRARLDRPSPNIPTLDAAFAYAGTVLVEGDEPERGARHHAALPARRRAVARRGRVAAALTRARAPGLRLPAGHASSRGTRSTTGRSAAGVEIHITDRRAFRPVVVAIALLLEVRRAFPDRFELRRIPSTGSRARPPSARRSRRGARSRTSSRAGGPALEEYVAGGLDTSLLKREREEKRGRGSITEFMERRHGEETRRGGEKRRGGQRKSEKENKKRGRCFSFSLLVLFLSRVPSVPSVSVSSGDVLLWVETRHRRRRPIRRTTPAPRCCPA